jgi:hypothetical protein
MKRQPGPKDLGSIDITKPDLLKAGQTHPGARSAVKLIPPRHGTPENNPLRRRKSGLIDDPCKGASHLEAGEPLLQLHQQDLGARGWMRDDEVQEVSSVCVTDRNYQGPTRRARGQRQAKVDEIAFHIETQDGKESFAGR